MHFFHFGCGTLRKIGSNWILKRLKCVVQMLQVYIKVFAICSIPQFGIYGPPKMRKRVWVKIFENLSQKMRFFPWTMSLLMYFRGKIELRWNFLSKSVSGPVNWQNRQFLNAHISAWEWVFRMKIRQLNNSKKILSVK